VPTKVREMIKKLEADGWVLARTRGSHRHFVHAGLVMGVPVSGYAIVIERAEDGGYGAWSPELPGCVALGDTPDEAVAEMRQAVKGHLAMLRERGEPIPAPTAVRVDLAPAA
jgi:predicted RNase H-like HicB family nuclease